MSSRSVRTDSQEITQDFIRSVVSLGGYTHPLFSPDREGATPDQGPPLPGQGVLLIMGGLLEQSGALDHAIALLELKSVKFYQMVRAGVHLSVELTPLAVKETSSGKLIQDYRWVVVDEQGGSVLEAHAVMLMNKKEGEVAS